MWRALFCLFFVTGCLAAPENWRGSNQLLVGGKMLSSDFDPAGDQIAVGYEYNARKHNLGFEVGLNYGYDRAVEDGISAKTETLEAYAGPRYTWDIGRWHPYVSLGLSFLYAHGKVVPEGGAELTDDGTTFGGYGAAGFDVDLGRAVMLGIGLRYAFLPGVGVGADDGDGSGPQGYLRLGYSF